MKVDEFPKKLGITCVIKPSKKQKLIIQRNIDTNRFIYNQLIANSFTDSAIYRLNKIDNQKRLLGLKRVMNNKTYSWLHLKEIDSLCPLNAERRYKAAWNMFRKVHNTGTPKFKSKLDYPKTYQTNCSYNKKTIGHESIYNGTIHFVDKKHLKLPKIGIVRTKLTYPLNDALKRLRIATVTIGLRADGTYYCSLLLKSDEVIKTCSKAPKQTPLGIDLNLENFATDSNGDVIDNPHYFKKSLKKLKKAQRALSRRQRVAKKQHKALRNAKHYQKQRLLVAKLHRKVMNQRNNFLHNLSTTLIKNHDLVVLEELRSSNMLKNHALASAISDVGWRTFIAQLEYKASMYDSQCITVDPKYTTQTCSNCGYLLDKAQNERLTLKDRKWICPICHTHHIRDVNAAKNILQKGLIKLNQ